MKQLIIIWKLIFPGTPRERIQWGVTEYLKENLHRFAEFAGTQLIARNSCISRKVTESANALSIATFFQLQVKNSFKLHKNSRN